MGRGSTAGTKTFCLKTIEMKMPFNEAIALSPGFPGGHL